MPADEDKAMKYGNLLRQWREELGMTTYEAEEALGVPRATISRWENKGAPPASIYALSLMNLRETLPASKEPIKTSPEEVDRMAADLD